MKRIKKTLKGKGKIVAALAVVISFASVIAWYTSMNAHAFGTYDAGGNKHFEEGHLTINMNGPDGKSDSLTMYIHSDDYAKNKKVSGKDFKKKQHNYTVTTFSGGGGDYSLTLNNQTIKSKINSNNNYTLLTIEVWYLLPAHEQHRSWDWVTVDKPTSVNANENITLYCGGNDGFWENSYHDTAAHWKSVNIHVSTALVGLTASENKTDTNPSGAWKTYDWCSINLNLDHTSGTLTFNGNNGQLRQDENSQWNNSVSKQLTDRQEYGDFPEGYRKGYELAGFYTNPYGQDGDWANEGWQFCSDYTIYAIWTPNTYSIEYDCGDGSGTMSKTTATYDTTVSLNKCTFKRKGYKFAGWSKTEGGAVDYKDNASFTYNTDDDITLYAVWEKDNWEVEFNGNGSSGTKYTADLAYNKTVNLPQNLFERPGYMFIGWAQKEDGDKEVPEEVKYTDGQAVKDLCEPGETCHLYAIWKKSDGSFETKNIIHDDKMFLGDVNLTGQNGTGYSNANIDSKSAHIDKEDDSGYFTDRYGSNNN